MRIRRSKKTVPNGPVPPSRTCNARRKAGGLCQKPAGWGTTHKGQGRCRRHGGNTLKRKSLQTGWYSSIEHHRLRDILGRLAHIEMNAMDLIPEAQLLRAMTVDYINRYETFSDALMAWYNDPEANQRPRRIMDIQDAAHLVESISRVVQRLHQIQSEGAISIATFQRVTEQMGIIVATHIKDPVILNAIEADWQNLALDSKAPPSTTPSDT